MFFVALTNFCFAEENQEKQNEERKLQSKIGGTIGLYIPDVPGLELQNGMRYGMFFHQTISKDFFLSLNLGYQNNKYANMPYELSRTSIPISLGCNLFLLNSKIRPYLGLELGLINRKVPDIIDSRVTGYNETNFIIIPTIGVSFPVSKNISLEMNARVERLKAEGIAIMMTRDGYYYHEIGNASRELNFGINFGIAYLIP